MLQNFTYFFFYNRKYWITKNEDRDNEGNLKLCREKFSGELESQLFDRIQSDRKFYQEEEDNIFEIKPSQLVEKSRVLDLNSSTPRLGKNQLLLLLSVIKASGF